MTETLIAQYGSITQARNVVDDLVSTGFPQEEVFLDKDSLQVKVMVPQAAAPEVQEILDRHNPS